MKTKRIISAIMAFAIIVSMMGVGVWAEDTSDECAVTVVMKDGSTKGYDSLLEARQTETSSDVVKFVVNKDITEDFSLSGDADEDNDYPLLYGEIVTENANGVVITSTAQDYVYMEDLTIGAGVTFKSNGIFYQDGENFIYGTVEVIPSDGIYYQGYDAKVTVSDGGKIIVDGSAILRYNKDADAGLYIYGDDDDSTVEFDCSYYIGAYSGTFYAEDANIETGYFLLKNSYDDSSYAGIDLTLDNSTLSTVGTTDGQKHFIADDDASITLTNGSSLNVTGAYTAADVVEVNVECGSSISDNEGVVAAPVALTAATPDELNTAISNATDGSVITITADGTYTLPSFGKDITIKAADGVNAAIGVAKAVTLSGANVIFENLTFEYPNVNYIGLQHIATTVYNNCTINGQMFLYGTSEIFNNCTFNQSSADAYNVWTYGAKNVEFNKCTFNCEGISVLVYNEGATGTVLEITDTDFIANTPVEGKAAIEIDSSLIEEKGYAHSIVVDDESAQNGFAAGNVSGNSLWNNKKGEAAEVTVAGEKVLEISKVLGSGTETAPFIISNLTQLKAFRDAVNAGESYAGKIVKLTADIDLKNEEWTPIGLDGDSTGFAGTFDGCGYTISNLNVDTRDEADNAAGLFGSVRGTLKNFTVKNAKVYNIVTEDPTVDGTAVIAGCTGYGAKIDNVHVDGAIVRSNRYVGGISGYAAGTFTNCTVKNVTLNAVPNEVSEGKYDNGDKIGGIIGYVNSYETTIDSCKLLGTNTINAYRDAGGIVGFVNESTSVTENTVEGTLAINIDTTLCGERDSYNTGAVIGRGTAGTNSDNVSDNATVNIAVKTAPKGTITPGYTNQDAVWGEAGANAEESFYVELYAGDDKIATTTLNNVGGIIDGDVYVTWSIPFAGSFDEYWTVVWEEGHPTAKVKPTKVALYSDGVKVAENDVQMNGPDNLNKVEWTELEIFNLKGEGTEESPYLIGSLREFKLFRDMVDEQKSDGTSQFAGKYFKLTADIDLDEDGDGIGENWNPIGSMTGDHGSFKGVFDGDGHTISNLYVEMAGNGLGLFARTAGNAEIKNLTINNATLKSTDNSNYIGAVVANSYASTKITNVHVTGKLDFSGRGYIGGISGHGYVVMDNCSVKAEGTLSSTFWCVGGLLGYGGEGATNITNSTVEGTGTGLVIRSAAGGLGGIIGMAEDNDGTQPIAGSDLTVKNVLIQTYVGAYGDAYKDYALGYVYGGNPTSKLTNITVENITFDAQGDTEPPVNDAVAEVDGIIYFDLDSAINAVDEDGDTVKLVRDITTNATFNINKNITLDLNGKTFTPAGTDGEWSVIINGDVKMTNGTINLDNVKSGRLAIFDVSDKLTLDNTVKMTGDNVDGSIFYLTHPESKLVMNGTEAEITNQTGDSAFIKGETGYPEVIIDSAKITITNGQRGFNNVDVKITDSEISMTGMAQHAFRAVSGAIEDTKLTVETAENGFKNTTAETLAIGGNSVVILNTPENEDNKSYNISGEAKLNISGGKYNTAPTAYLAEGKQVVYDTLTGLYSIADTWTVSATASVGELYADDTVQITVKAAGSNFNNAEWELTYDASRFEFVKVVSEADGYDADYEKEGVVFGGVTDTTSNDSYTSNTTLAVYEFKALAQTEEVTGAFTLTEAAVGTDAMSINTLPQAAVAAPAEVTILLKDFEVTVKDNGNVISGTTHTISYDDKDHTIVAENTAGADVYYSVNGGAESTTAPVIKEPGTYEITYWVDVPAGYDQTAKTPVTITVTIGDPEHLIEVASGEYVAGYKLVLVYTNVDNAYFTYDGEPMLDVTAAGYNYTDDDGDVSSQEYAHVYGYVVPTIMKDASTTAGNDAYRVKVEFTKNETPVAVNPYDYNINCSEKATADIADVGYIISVYNAKDGNMAESNMKRILKADAAVDATTGERNKKVDTHDITPVKNERDANR